MQRNKTERQMSKTYVIHITTKRLLNIIFTLILITLYLKPFLLTNLYFSFTCKETPPKCPQQSDFTTVGTLSRDLCQKT